MSISALGSLLSNFVERAVASLAVRVAVLTTVGWFSAVRTRLLPKTLLKLHFNVHLLIAAIGANVVIISSRILRPFLPKRVIDEWLRFWTTVCMRYHRVACCHVKIKYAPGSLSWSDVPCKGSVVCVNHLSFFDVLLFMWIAPLWHMKKLKTFYKSDLGKVPLLGCILRDCGMLPVYFLKGASNEFSVDRDRQQKVNEEANAFVAEGLGNLSFYPEGGVNRQCPRELATFRHGSFSLILQNHCQVLYYVLTCGNETIWPPKEAAGGNAGTVLVKIGKMKIDYSDSTLDAKTLSEKTRTVMQKELDELYAMKDADPSLR